LTKENYTRYIILGFLRHQPLSGYLIRKYVEKTISFFWNLSNGQIYPTLQSMHNEGLVTWSRQASLIGPDSKVYSITAKGREVLDAWLAEPLAEENFRSPLLLKIFFGGDSNKEIIIKDLQNFMAESKEKLTVMELFERNYRNIAGENPDHLFMYLTALRGKQWYRANVQWAEDAIKILKRGEVLVQKPEEVSSLYEFQS